DDCAQLYAVLDEARRLSVEAGETQLALEACERLGNEFQINPAKFKAEVLNEVTRSIRNDGQREALVSATMATLAELIAADECEAAAEILRVATASARRLHEADLTKRLVARGRQVDQVVEAYREMKKTQGAGRDADLAAGRYLCFLKGDWESGLAR